MAAVLVLAACGGDGAERAADPPGAVLIEFVVAVRMGDSEAVRNLLSEKFLDRYDLTDEKLASSFIPALRSKIGPLGPTVEAGFERTIGADLAVAAFKDASARALPGPRAFASPLVREEDGWKVEPFGLDLIYGYPDDLSADSKRPFITFGVNATGDLKARLWVDGRELPLKRRPGSPVTFEARPVERLEPGQHLVVAFAKVGDRVGALAWRSTVE